MKVRLDCPVNFLESSELKEILTKRGLQIDQSDPDIVVVNPGTNRFLDEAYFSTFENLKYVVSPSTGTNHIDLNFLNVRGIKVFCLLDDKESLRNIHASAEFTWVHIMNLQRKFIHATQSVDLWRSDENELTLRSNELFGKKIGIVGMGRIGNKVAKYAKAFGLDVLFYDPYVFNSETESVRVNCITDLSMCDIISINCSLNKDTKNMINFGVWDNIREGTIIVNTSRGEVVNEDYIIHLIDKNKIMFGADVLQNEQDIDSLKQSPIYKMSKVSNRIVLTPHVAGATKESQTKALVTVLDLIKQ